MMQSKSIRPFLIFSSVVVSAFLFFQGCESAETHAIDVTPAQSDLTAANQSVTLSAAGWSNYAWTLSDPSIGILSSPKGSSVRYTAKSMPAANTKHLMQTVTVTALEAVNSPGATAGTSYTGKAKVRHVSPGGSGTSNTGGGGTGTPTQSLIINPSDTQVISSINDSQSFSVENPLKDYVYTWTLSNSSLGRLVYAKDPPRSTAVYYPKDMRQLTQTIKVVGTIPNNAAATKYEGSCSVIHQQ